jgi:hypothetical protein
MKPRSLYLLNFRHKKRRPWTSFFDHLGRGNLKQIGIYLFFLVNNLLVNLLGIPVGTLRGLDSDGRCILSFAAKTNRGRFDQANGRAADCCPWARRSGAPSVVFQKHPWKSGHHFTRALPADKVARIPK